jgi:hypothetical protein
MKRIGYGFKKKPVYPCLCTRLPVVPVSAVPAARRGCTRPVPAGKSVVRPNIPRWYFSALDHSHDYKVQTDISYFYLFEKSTDVLFCWIVDMLINCGLLPHISNVERFEDYVICIYKICICKMHTALYPFCPLIVIFLFRFHFSFIVCKNDNYNILLCAQ